MEQKRGPCRLEKRCQLATDRARTARIVVTSHEIQPAWPPETAARARTCPPPPRRVASRRQKPTPRIQPGKAATAPFPSPPRNRRRRCSHGFPPLACFQPFLRTAVGTRASVLSPRGQSDGRGLRRSTAAMSSAKGGGGGPGAEEGVVVVRWPELQGRLAGAGRRAAELAAAAEARAGLACRLEAALGVRRESLRQGAALDEMRRRLELLRRRAEEAVIGKRRALVGVERLKEQLQAQIERVLPLSRALAAAYRQVQEANEVLCADKEQLEDLQRLLRIRQQCMISQVAVLYPVRVFHDLLQPENHRDADCNGELGTLSEQDGTLSGENGNGTHVLSVIKSPQVRPLMFFGWQITKHKRKQKSYSDKELLRSAAVLGYAAHAVLLIASYLDVPLRYPLHFGGSRSYVSDRLPSAETASVASAEYPSADSPDSELTEYPLFQECQEDDSTKASYAIYLLHKDTEQLLNYIGAESSGRHVFGNLRELIRIIQSDEYVYI